MPTASASAAGGRACCCRRRCGCSGCCAIIPAARRGDPHPPPAAVAPLVGRRGVQRAGLSHRPKVVVHSSLASLHRHIELAQFRVYGGLRRRRRRQRGRRRGRRRGGCRRGGAVAVAHRRRRAAAAVEQNVCVRTRSCRRLEGKGTKAEARSSSGAMADDELLRFLSDTAPPHDVPQALRRPYRGGRARPRRSPRPDATRAAWRHVLRSRHQPPARALLVVINRELQDALLIRRADGYILALVGALEDVRLEVFNGPPTASRRSRRSYRRRARRPLSCPHIRQTHPASPHRWSGAFASRGSRSVAAVQRMMAVLQDIYPNYSTKLYIVRRRTSAGSSVSLGSLRDGAKEDRVGGDAAALRKHFGEGAVVLSGVVFCVS